MEKIKSELIDMLSAIHEVGFRESLVCDDELTSLLMTIGDELKIDPDEYLQDDTQNSGWIPDEQQAGCIA